MRTVFKKTWLAISILALLALLSVSCGPHLNQDPNPRDIDPDLEDYVLEFDETYGTYTDYEVLLVDEELGERKSTIGTCGRRGTYRIVKIEREFWERSTPERRRGLVYHELGHCTLNLAHREGSMEVIYYDADRDLYANRDVPYSLMNPWLIPGWALEQFWDHYRNQLWEEVQIQSKTVDEDEEVYHECSEHPSGR